MTTKEVYPEATVVDNESHNVSQTENETQGIITKWKGEAKDKITNGVWTCFKINSSENNKAIFLPVGRKFHREEVSQLSLIPATFVTIWWPTRINISILLKMKEKGRDN